MESNNERDPRPVVMTPRRAIYIACGYFVAVGLLVSVGGVWGLVPTEPLHDGIVPWWGDVIIGLVIGLMIVGMSQFLVRFIPPFRRVSEELSRLLGPISLGVAFIIAFSSGIAEEILFRGGLQQYLDHFVFTDHLYGDYIAILIASFIFAILHTGPNFKLYLPWTIFAFVFGLIAGILYLITGNLIAPIVTHFVINFINLSLLKPSYEDAT